MNRSRMLCALCLVLMVMCTMGYGQDFSIDQASPEYGVRWSSADLIMSLGAGTVLTATQLGLIYTDEIDAFSYGGDSIIPPGPYSWVHFFYSVTRPTVGAPGSIVNTEALGNGAAGDKFRLRINGNGTFVGPSLQSDAPMHTLAPLPPPQSDLDGMSLVITQTGIYFSVNPATATRLGVDRADILLQSTAGVTPGPITVYASLAALGLTPGDDIDAILVIDANGQLDTGDFVCVSLTPGSPTLTANGWSPASVIRVSPGPMAQLLTPANLGLLTTDDLNAMTTIDPGECGFEGTSISSPGILGVWPCVQVEAAIFCPAGDADVVNPIFLDADTGEPVIGLQPECYGLRIGHRTYYGDEPTDINGHGVISYAAADVSNGEPIYNGYGFAVGQITYGPIKILSYDLNADRCVDQIDMDLFEEVYEGEYDQAYDFNCDGQISLFDLSMISSHMGHCHPTTGVEPRPQSHQGDLKLMNAPNPFNVNTRIQFVLQTSERVDLRIYDPRGALVRRLINGVRAAGEHTIIWDGMNDHRSEVGPGVYMYHLKTAAEEQSGRMIVIK